MSSDSEPNSFANLSSSSDEDVMQEDENAEEIHGQITPYEDEPKADSKAAERTADGLTPAVLEARYEREIAVCSWFL